MSHDHLDAFLHALHEKDADALMEHVTEDVTLWSPIFSDPFQGKTKLRSVLAIVLGAVDRFEIIEVMHGAEHRAVAFRLQAAGVSLDGMDLITLAPDGRVASLKIMWRPLPAIVAVQNLIAPHVGAPALTLVPAPTAA